MAASAWRLAMFIVVCLGGVNIAGAASLGNITVETSVGQPLRAIIIADVGPLDDLDRIAARIASDETHEAFGINFDEYLRSIRINRRTDNGELEFVLTSADSLRQFYLEFVFELRLASGGSVYRSYTLLPDFDLQRSRAETAALDTAPVATAERQATLREPRAVTIPAPSSATRRVPREPVPAGRYRVQSLDSIWLIAERMDRGLGTITQRIALLKLLNPSVAGAEPTLHPGDELIIPKDATALAELAPLEPTPPGAGVSAPAAADPYRAVVSKSPTRRPGKSSWSPRSRTSFADAASIEGVLARAKGHAMVRLAAVRGPQFFQEADGETTAEVDEASEDVSLALEFEEIRKNLESLSKENQSLSANIERLEDARVEAEQRADSRVSLLTWLLIGVILVLILLVISFWYLGRKRRSVESIPPAGIEGDNFFYQEAGAGESLQLLEVENVTPARAGSRGGDETAPAAEPQDDRHQLSGDATVSGPGESSESEAEPAEVVTKTPVETPDETPVETPVEAQAEPVEVEPDADYLAEAVALETAAVPPAEDLSETDSETRATFEARELTTNLPPEEEPEPEDEEAEEEEEPDFDFGVREVSRIRPVSGTDNGAAAGRGTVASFGPAQGDQDDEGHITFEPVLEYELDMDKLDAQSEDDDVDYELDDFNEEDAEGEVDLDSFEFDSVEEDETLSLEVDSLPEPEGDAEDEPFDEDDVEDQESAGTPPTEPTLEEVTRGGDIAATLAAARSYRNLAPVPDPSAAEAEPPPLPQATAPMDAASRWGRLIDEWDLAMLEEPSSGSSYAVFYLDVDDVENLENRFGPLKAETLLLNVQQLIEAELGERRSVLHRIKDHTFMFLATYRTEGDLAAMGDGLLRLIRDQEFRADGETVPLTLSVGIVPVTSTTAELDDYLHLGKSMVEQVRQDPGGGMVAGDGLAMHDDGSAAGAGPEEARFVTIVQDLLRNKMFEVRYQTLINLMDTRVQLYLCKTELSSKVDRETLPDKFLEKAFACAVTPAIERYSIAVALNKLLTLGTRVKMLFRIDIRSAMDPAFEAWLFNQLETTGIDPERVILFVYASDVMLHRPHISRFTSTLKRKGIRLGMLNVDYESNHLQAAINVGASLVRISPSIVDEVVESTVKFGTRPVSSGTRESARLRDFLADFQNRSIETILFSFHVEAIPGLVVLNASHLRATYIQTPIGMIEDQLDHVGEDEGEDEQDTAE